MAMGQQEEMHVPYDTDIDIQAGGERSELGVGAAERSFP
jgi:hypothetical protein